MATKKTSKKPNKRFLKKVHELTERDIFRSVALASIGLNIFAIAAFLVLTNTNSFDRSLYTSVRDKYCNNIDEVRNRAEKLGDEQAALLEWKVTCVSEDYKPFYRESIKKFEATLKTNEDAKVDDHSDHDHQH